MSSSKYALSIFLILLIGLLGSKAVEGGSKGDKVSEIRPISGSSYYIHYYPVINGSKKYDGVIYLNLGGGGQFKCPSDLCGQPIFTPREYEVTFVQYPFEYLGYREWVKDLRKKMKKSGVQKSCPEYLENFQFTEEIFQEIARNQSELTSEQARKRIGKKSSCETLATLFDINTNDDYTGHILRWYMYEEYIKSIKPIATYTISVPPYDQGSYEQHIQVDLATKEVKLLFSK